MYSNSRINFLEINVINDIYVLHRQTVSINLSQFHVSTMFRPIVTIIYHNLHIPGFTILSQYYLY